MNNRQVSVILISVAVFAAMGLAAWLFAARTHAQERTPNIWDRGGPFKVLDDAARSATRDVEAAVRALTEDVFTVYPHSFGRMPAAVESIVKDRLTKAQIDHMRGARPGVREEDVANVVNMVAERLHLPEYAKTSAKQVRALRMLIAVESPVFMGRGMADAGGKLRDTINPEMSPLQATHLAAVLLDQKFMDPDYQFGPVEWEQNSQQRQTERLKWLETLRQARAQNPGKSFLFSRNNPKHDEMLRAFDNGVANLGMADAIDMMNSAFTSFGIEI